MLDFSLARHRMVHVQLASRGILNREVLGAMRAVPRELFVDPGFEEFAYEDGALPIGESQTISQPYIVALMIEAAELKASDCVLEVGAGSGYSCAVMSRITSHVHAIERHPSLAEAAQRRLSKLGHHNVTLRVGDGTLGWPEAGPFHAILVAAGGPEVPQALQQQLAVGGRLIIPVGSAKGGQALLKVTRRSQSDFEQKTLGAVTFVPLIGEQGWAEDGRQVANNPLSGPSPK